MPKLKNYRHERFCREYVRRNFNGSAAARAVGVPEGSVRTTASAWLAKPNIFARVEELADDALADVMMTKQEVINQMAKLANFNPQDAFDDEGRLIPIHEMDEATAASIKEIEHAPGEFKVKFSDQRRAALSDLMRHYNAFEDHQKAGAGEMNVYLDSKDAEA